MSKNRAPVRLEVQRGEWLTPTLRRLILGGEGIADYVPNDFTDCYVKLRFGTDDEPELRTYTVRDFDSAAGEITIDFVVHGDRGLAGPWARDAQPGDEITFVGPSGAYRPDPDADWHLLVGDESAIPAIAAALEALPREASGHVIVEVDSAEHQVDLPAPKGITVTWLHRDVAEPAARDPRDHDAPSAADTQLARAVRWIPWSDGEPHVFVHGEAHTVMRGIRPYIRKERGVPAERASISGYWRRGLDHDNFKAWKKEFNSVEAATG